jgi:hypothetical protein
MNSKAHFYKGYFNLTTEEMFQERMSIVCSSCGGAKKYKGPSLEYFLVLQEFKDVFQELLGLPPKREINFSIDLVQGYAPISKKHYIISRAEFK